MCVWLTHVRPLFSPLIPLCEPPAAKSLNHAVPALHLSMEDSPSLMPATVLVFPRPCPFPCSEGHVTFLSEIAGRCSRSIQNLGRPWLLALAGLATLVVTASPAGPTLRPCCQRSPGTSSGHTSTAPPDKSSHRNRPALRRAHSPSPAPPPPSTTPSPPATTTPSAKTPPSCPPTPPPSTASSQPQEPFPPPNTAAIATRRPTTSGAVGPLQQLPRSLVPQERQHAHR